ncbi:MAG: glycosyltransferase family 4 protein [Planctomycetota bacterium]
MKGRLRVALFSELPTPYRWPVFERLLARPELSLRVFFCARGEPDRDWSFPFEPDGRVRFLPVTTLSRSGARSVHVHVNPTVFGELARGRFDVVVLPGYAMFASQAGALWCRATGTPYVLFSETTHLGRRRPAVRALKRLLLPVLVGGAKAWLATGSLSREYLVSWGARGEDVFPFPNSPDVEAFGRGARRSEELRRAHGVTDETVVLFVARLLGVKRADLLIEAAARLTDRGKKLAVWIAGEGAERESLRHLAREVGCVSFLGNVATGDLPALYGSADIFVLPSDHEPWGAVVGEAMACGLPVVVSDHVGSAPDLVVPDETGLVFPRGDAAALADTLERLLSDPGRRRRMGRRAAERIAAYSHDACVESFLRAVHTAARAR